MTDSSESQRSLPGFSASDALAELHGEVARVLRAGGPVPCVTDPEGGWTSDDRRAQVRAADRCLDCAAFAGCERFAIEHPMRAGVWGGRIAQIVAGQPRTYGGNTRHVSIEDGAKQPLNRAFTEPKEEPMAKPNTTKTVSTGTCLCGCNEPTARNYRPGHDARHVSQLVREVAAGLDKRAALKALPTEPLRAKLTRALDKAKPVAA